MNFNLITFWNIKLIDEKHALINLKTRAII